MYGHQSIRSSFTHLSVSPEHLQCSKPSNEAEQLADSTLAAEEARAWGTSSKWYAWLGSEEADPSSTSSIGPCESHPRTSHGVSPGCFLQHGLWRACPPRLTPPVTALSALPILVPRVYGKAHWAWSWLPSLCFPPHHSVDPPHYFCSCSVAVPTLLGPFLCCLKGTCLPSPVWHFPLTQVSRV